MNQTEENNTIDMKGDVNISRHVEQPNLASIMNRLEREEKERLFQKWLNTPLQDDQNCLKRENVNDNYTHRDFIDEFLRDLLTILKKKKKKIQKNKLKAFKNEVVNIFYKQSFHKNAVY